MSLSSPRPLRCVSTLKGFAVHFPGPSSQQWYTGAHAVVEGLDSHVEMVEGLPTDSLNPRVIEMRAVPALDAKFRRWGLTDIPLGLLPPPHVV